jgi:hypothetical protein
MRYVLVVLFLAQFNFFKGEAWAQGRGMERSQSDHEYQRGQREQGERRPKKGHCKKRRKTQQSNSSDNYYAPDYGMEERKNYGRYAQEI